jgi:hypothetical protein
MAYQSDLIFILLAIRKHDLASSKMRCFTYWLGPIYLFFYFYTAENATFARLRTQ